MFKEDLKDIILLIFLIVSLIVLCWFYAVTLATDNINGYYVSIPFPVFLISTIILILVCLMCTVDIITSHYYNLKNRPERKS